MVPYLLQIWQVHHNSLASKSGSLEKAHLALKVLRKTIVHGLKKPSEDQQAMMFLAGLTEQTRGVLRLREFYEWTQLKHFGLRNLNILYEDFKLVSYLSY